MDTIEMMNDCQSVLNSGDEPASSQHRLYDDVEKNTGKIYSNDFKDQVHRIDYVLAYSDTEERRQKRSTFEESLIEEGLLLEYEEDSDSAVGEEVCFVKIHAPWEVLTRYAELMGLKVPIKEDSYDGAEEEGCCLGLSTCCRVDKELVPEEADFFTTAYNRQYEEFFRIKDKDAFFTDNQRSIIVFEILKRAEYNHEKQKYGINKLLSNGSYLAAYPLHKGDYKDEENPDRLDTDRKLLYSIWASAKSWYKEQPLDLIRKYFGEKYGFYFAWLGFYTRMLISASVVGFLCFIYGLVTFKSNTPANDVCDTVVGNTVMCPQCDVKCPYWYINETCTYTRFTFLFDNPATVFFAVFMAVWATLFLEFWQRRQHVLAWDWDVQNFDDEETVRPQYEKQATEKKLNPVTQQEQPHIPWSTRFIAKTYSFCSLFFLLVLVMAAVFGVIVYRIIIGTLLYMNEKDAVRNTSSIVTSITASIINLIVIMILGQVYKLLAKFFTDMECPRTYTEYEDSYTFKMFLFQFVNIYSSLFYVAFFKGRFYGYPGNVDSSIFGYRLDQCDPSGCMVELVIQLTTIMIGKQFFNNIKEIVMPKLMKWIKKILKGETEASAPRTSWERDYLVQGDPLLGFFDEYLEMVIQYGFITLFVAAFPLAPLFALLNNIMEIRIDAYKYTVEYRRPLAARAQDIGIWYSILRSITILAVIFNAFVISTTSDFIQRLVYMYGYSDNKNLEGYMNNSLSVFATKDFPANTGPDYSHITINTELRDTEFCRYRGYRYPPGDVKEYQVNLQHWHIFTAQLAFVVVFEHVVFFLAWFIAVIIPNVPQSVKDQMEREKYLAKTVIYKLESERAKKARKGQDSSFPRSEARVSGLTNF